MTSDYRLTGGLTMLLASILAAFAFGALRATASPSAHLPATAASARPVPAFKHIFVIVMENKDYESVLGGGQAPYMSGLCRETNKLGQLVC